MKATLVLILGVLVTSNLAEKNYEGYHILETSVVTKESLSGLLVLEKNSRFDMLTRPIVGRSLRVMTSLENVHELWEKLEKLNLKPQIHVNNVDDVLKKDRNEWQAIKNKETKSTRALTFERYMTLDEIMEYIDELATNYPNLVQVEDLGTSYEGRVIRALRISNGPGKRMVFLDAGMHSREYAGPPVALKMLYELVENYDNNKEMVDMLDWLIIPVVNPDGYAFTWNGDRFWRKNRRPNNGSDCVGTDPNRNFDFHWGEDLDDDFCSQAYHGTHAFSEPESEAIGKILREQGPQGKIALYMATHTYGSFLMYPWAYTYVLPSNADDLQAAGDLAAEAIKAVNNESYIVGSTANVYLRGYGASMDYGLGVAEVLYSYTWELVAGGVTGFNPPNEKIDPIATETWAGIKELAKYANAN